MRDGDRRGGGRWGRGGDEVDEMEADEDKVGEEEIRRRFRLDVETARQYDG